MLDIQQVAQQLKQITQQGLVLCEQLERGQAETPLADHIQKIHQDIQDAPLSIVLVGLSRDALQAALKWLYGDTFSVLYSDNKTLPGLTEITLSDKNYLIQQGLQHTQSFDQLEAFQQAMEIEFGTAASSSVMDPLKLGIKSERDSRGFRLLIPENASSILDKPGMLNALVSEANVLMVAAPIRYTLSREDHEVIEELSRNMAAFWPLLTVDELNEDASLPEVGWWEQHKQAQALIDAKLLTTHVTPSLPDFLTDENHPTRQAYFYQLQAYRLSEAINAIYQRYQQDAALLQQRKEKLQGQGQASYVDGGDRREWDKLRQTMDDAFSNIRKEQEQSIQAIGLQGSALSQALKAHVDGLTFTEIEQVLGHSTVKLNLKDSALATLRELLLKQGKHIIKAQHQQCEAQTKSLHVTISQSLQALAMPSPSTSVMPKRSSLYDALDQRLELNVNYRGEMPKRTFKTRLGESRKVIMGVSMLTMVLGGMGKALWDFDLRASVMAIAPLLIIGGFLYTYIVWPKEDAEKMLKELERVRDGLNGEVKRTVGEMQRFIQTLINDILETQRRHWQSELQDIHHKHQELQRQQETEQKQQQQQKLQSIEQELRHWQNIESQLKRLKYDSAELSRSLES